MCVCVCFQDDKGELWVEGRGWSWRCMALRNLSTVTLKYLCMCVRTTQYLWLQKSISLPSIIQREKCSHLIESSGNLYFWHWHSSCLLVTESSLCCAGWGRGADKGGEEENRGEGIIVIAFLSSLPQCRSPIQQRREGCWRRREGEGRRISCWAKMACTLTNKWETKGVISITEATLILKFFCQELALTSLSRFVFVLLYLLNIHLSFCRTHHQESKRSCQNLSSLTTVCSHTHTLKVAIYEILHFIAMVFFRIFQRLPHDNIQYFLSDQPWWLTAHANWPIFLLYLIQKNTVNAARHIKGISTCVPHAFF